MGNWWSRADFLLVASMITIMVLITVIVTLDGAL